MIEKLKALYTGNTKKAHTFRLALLALDFLTIASFIVTSIIDNQMVQLVLDYTIAVLLIADFTARAAIANKISRLIFRFETAADILVIGSLLASALFDNLGFLRVVRMLRLMRSYHMLRTLRKYLPWFKQNEQIINSTLNLAIFVFVVTAIVYVLEHQQNAQINNYLDALYYTVATLTTTGFGDITLEDPMGRTVSVIIMIFGVALFLRLVQTIFRPTKVRYECKDCGLKVHEPDAVHCKHCGAILNIPTDGNWA